jgi:hypothetical protein
MSYVTGSSWVVNIPILGMTSRPSSSSSSSSASAPPPEWDLLLSAAQKNDVETIKSLVQPISQGGVHGVNPSHGNAVQQTALHIAALWGHSTWVCCSLDTFFFVWIVFCFFFLFFFLLCSTCISIYIYVSICECIICFIIPTVFCFLFFCRTSIVMCIIDIYIFYGRNDKSKRYEN